MKKEEYPISEERVIVPDGKKEWYGFEQKKVPGGWYGSEKVFCKDCDFYRFGPRGIPAPTGQYEPSYIHASSYCTERHKILTDTPIERIDDSDNCFVKNQDNHCKYFKKKMEEE